MTQASSLAAGSGGNAVVSGAAPSPRPSEGRAHAVDVLRSSFDCEIATRSALRAAWDLIAREDAPRVLLVLAHDPTDAGLVFHAEFLASVVRAMTRVVRDPPAELHWPYHVRSDHDDPARRPEVVDLATSHPQVDVIVVETEWPAEADVPTRVARIATGGGERLAFVLRGIGPRIEPVPEVAPLEVLRFLAGPVLPAPVAAPPAARRDRLTRIQREWLAVPAHAAWHPVTPRTRATVLSLERRALVETNVVIADAVATLHCRALTSAPEQEEP
jgi:hypothetical protein